MMSAGMLRFLLLLVCLVPGAALADRLKDLADVAGIPTSMGSPACRVAPSS